MELAGINQLLKINKLLREVAMITTTSSHLRSNSNLMGARIVLAMGMARLHPTVNNKVMVKMAMVAIMWVQLNLLITSPNQTLVQDTTNSNKGIILPMAMPLTQHLTGTLLHMERRATPIKHLHLDSRIMPVVNPARIPITHLKLLSSQVMVCPHLHRVVMEPHHHLVTEVMGQLRLKNLAVSQLMHSHSSHLVLRVAAMLRLDILILSLHLHSQDILRQIPVPNDLLHQDIQHLIQGMESCLMEHHKQLSLAMDNSRLHHITVLIVVGTPSLQFTLLMPPPVVMHAVLMMPSHLNQPSQLGLSKPHPLVNEFTLLMFGTTVMYTTFSISFL